MKVSIRLFALYFYSRLPPVYRESREGRVMAYSPTRLTANTTTKTANVGRSAKIAYPAVMISGMETKRARRPIHLNKRLKRNSWVRREKACTQKSTSEKKRVR